MLNNFFIIISLLISYLFLLSFLNKFNKNFLINICICFFFFSYLVISLDIISDNNFKIFLISLLFLLSNISAFVFSGISNSVSYGMLCILKEKDNLPAKNIYSNYILKKCFNKRLESMCVKNNLIKKDGYYYLTKKGIFYAKIINFIHIVYGINLHG